MFTCSKKGDDGDGCVLTTGRTMTREDFCWNGLSNTLRLLSHLGLVVLQNAAHTNVDVDPQAPPPPPVEICRGKQNERENISSTTVHHEHRYSPTTHTDTTSLLPAPSQRQNVLYSFSYPLPSFPNNHQTIAPATQPDMTTTQRQNTITSIFIFCRISVEINIPPSFAHPLLPHQGTHPPSPSPSARPQISRPQPSP